MTQATAEPRAHDWSLLTRRGLALLYIARHPGCTKRELAESLNVSERSATSILSELATAGAVRSSNGDGRRLHYEVDPKASLEVQEGKRTTLGSLLDALDG